MRGRAWLAALEGPARGAPADWSDVLERATEQDRPTAWLAAEMGVTVRSAERYLAAIGEGKGGQGAEPKRPEARAAAARLVADIQRERDAAAERQSRQDAADLIREIRSIRPGQIMVVPTSDPRRPNQTSRQVDWISVDASAMARVADAWEDGDDREAELALSDAILAPYGEDGGHDDLEFLLRITDFDDHMDYE